MEFAELSSTRTEDRIADQLERLHHSLGLSRIALWRRAGHGAEFVCDEHLPTGAPALSADDAIDWQDADGPSAVAGRALRFPVGPGSDPMVVLIAERDGADRWTATDALRAFAAAQGIAISIERAQRFAAEENARDVHARASEVEQLAGLGSWSWDVTADRVTWSDNLRRMARQPLDGGDYDLDSFLAFVHPDDQAMVSEVIETALKNEPGYEFQARSWLPDGGSGWIQARAMIERDSAGRPVRVFGTIQDTTELRRTQEALRSSEARFRGLFDQFPLSVQIFDPTGRTLQVNREFVNFWGYGMEALEEFNVLTEPQLEPIRELVKRGLDGEMVFLPPIPFDGSRVATAPDALAGLRQIQAFIFPVKDENDQVRELIFVHQDVTQDKLREEMLKISEESYRTIFDLASDGIFVHHPVTGAVLDVNRQASELHRMSMDELKASGLDAISDPSSPGSRDRAIGYIRRAAAGEPQCFEWAVKRGDESVWVEVSLNRVTILGEDRVLANVRNIDTRKRAEEALRRANEELEGRVAERTTELQTANEELVRRTEEMEGIFRALPDLYFRLRPNGSIQHYRTGTGHSLRGSPADIPGRTLAEVMPLDIVPLVTGALTQVAETGKLAIFDYEVVEDGCSREYEARILPMPDGSMIAMVRDITARKRAERAHETAKEEAERANRAKSEFLSRMSHELRTPMNSILGFAQLLDRTDIPADQRRAVQHILKAGRHLLQLINEVLEIARIEAGRQNFSLESVRLRGVIREAVALVRPLAAQRGVHIEDGPWENGDNFVMADRQRLVQVLLNLVSNAIKYNRPGGRVRLRCSMPEGAEPGRISVRVEDTGRGIPADRTDQLFTPFARLGAEQTEVEGTGLGLALSQRLTESMGGELQLESTGSGGSVFRLDLVVATDPAGALEEAQTLAPKSMDVRHDPATIIYIEDNLANLSLVETILASRPRWRTIPALQGQLGVELAREHRPDLILLDLHLPDISGIEVLRRLRADVRTRHIPVIIISADATEGSRIKLEASGADGYLTKPLDVDEFLVTLHEFLNQDEK